jgi:hypothetical protein
MMTSKRKSQVLVNFKDIIPTRGSMFTGNSMNPTLNQKQNIISSQRPMGFAIIPVRDDNPVDNSLANRHHSQISLAPHEHLDIQKITQMLQDTPQPTIPLGKVSKTINIPFDETHFQHKNSPDAYTSSDNAPSTLASVLGGVVIGMILNKKLNTAPPGKNNLFNKKEIADNLAKAIPDLVQSFAVGTSMIAGTIGLTRWLNQETPDRLKARLDAMKDA